MNYRNDVIRNFAEQDILVREMKRKDSKSQEDKNPSTKDETPSSSFMFVTKVNRIESKDK
jgi:hypothetical protein